jgi:uncharacterized protein YggE
MRMISALLLSATLALPIAVPAFADSQITVTGEVTIQATPDMATISLGVTTTGKTGAEAMNTNSQSMQAVIDRLKAAGVDDHDLQTSNLSLNPNWVSDTNGTAQKIDGYTASNMLSVRVRDLAKVGAVLDACITDGANTLNGITFDLSEPRPALDEARKAAVADARARAELLVTAAGAKLGKIVSISENQSYGQPMPVTYSKAADAMAVPVAAGQVGMSSSVTLVFEITE